MRNHFLIFWVVTICFVPRPASSGELQDRLSRSLSAFDTGNVPTGILYDRVLPLSGIDRYDGRLSAPPITPATWRQVHHELLRASLVDRNWLRPRALFDSARPEIRDGVTPIALMNVRYDRIRADAFTDGTLVMREGRVAVTGAKPLDGRRAFAVVALRDYTYRGKRVQFEIGKQWYVSNDVDPAALQVDFDDGLGFRASGFDQRHSVSYETPGDKIVRVRSLDPAGNVLYGSFGFRVLALATPLPHDTLQITASIPYNAQFGTGEAYVYLADSTGSVTNPVIVVEGFDIEDNMNWDELYALLNKEQLVEDLRAEGYDAIVLNFTEATDPIQSNAFVVIELIEQVQALIAPEQDIVVAGASMGGLNVRYALAYMETNAINHRVRTYISFDSPHRGANIPLGMQYWLDFFKDNSADAEFLLGRLDTPAARQMLVYHHTTPPGTSGAADPLRASLLADFSAVGNYPSESRNAAIANGSGTGANQGFAAGAQIIRWDYSSFLVDVIGNVWAVPDASPTTIFDGKLDIILLPAETQTVSVSATLPYDNAPGGFRGSMKQMDETDAPFGDIVALYDDHCFIPTISALDINTTDLYYDIDGDPVLVDNTPFDAVYFPSENQEHVDITAENEEWFKYEVRFDSTLVAADRPVPRGTPWLFQNTPNPFNPTTTIRFSIPSDAHVTLSVFSVTGQRVATLVDAMLPAGPGEIVWDGENSAGHEMSSGVYFYRLRADGWTDTRKMVLLK